MNRQEMRNDWKLAHKRLTSSAGTLKEQNVHFDLYGLDFLIDRGVLMWDNSCV